jgi:membrane protease YdiL (CAAX protease family)
MSRRVRALPGLLGFLLLVIVILPIRNRWLNGVLTDSTANYIVGHLIDLTAVLIFSAVMARIERRPFGAYGLPWNQALRSRFWQGAVAGIVALTVLVLTLRLCGALEMRAPATPPLRALGFGAIYALLFFVLAYREEFLYRGYVMFALTNTTTFWLAAALTTTWFTWTHHGPRENWIGLANVALFGMVACFTLLRTGNLWLALGFHAAWDWGETYFYGVSDSGHAAAPGHLVTSLVPPSSPAWLSGGPVGPEGSVLCTAVMLLLGIACVLWLPRGRKHEAAMEAAPAIAENVR